MDKWEEELEKDIKKIKKNRNILIIIFVILAVIILISCFALFFFLKMCKIYQKNRKLCVKHIKNIEKNV